MWLVRKYGNFSFICDALPGIDEPYKYSGINTVHCFHLLRIRGLNNLNLLMYIEFQRCYDKSVLFHLYSKLLIL